MRFLRVLKSDMIIECEKQNDSGMHIASRLSLHNSSSSRASCYGHNFKEYFREANAKLIVAVQVETSVAVSNIEAIAAVRGVDIFFVGHSDLSMDLGCFGDYSSGDMRASELKVLSAARRFGKRAGMLLKADMGIEEQMDKGYSFLALGTDIGCLKTAYNNLLGKA